MRVRHSCSFNLRLEIDKISKNNKEKEAGEEVLGFSELIILHQDKTLQKQCSSSGGNDTKKRKGLIISALKERLLNAIVTVKEEEE